jgi:hypothetical protein
MCCSMVKISGFIIDLVVLSRNLGLNFIQFLNTLSHNKLPKLIAKLRVSDHLPQIAPVFRKVHVELCLVTYCLYTRWRFTRTMLNMKIVFKINSKKTNARISRVAHGIT